MTERGFVYGGNTILSHPVFVETILPFLLVFTIVFAILQKSKIFGDGKRQIDAIVALVVGLLFISFAQATGIVIQLIPFLGVALVIILVFMILLGSFFKEGELASNIPSWIKWILIVGVLIAVVSAVLYITNAWEFVLGLIFMTGGSGAIVVNVIFIIIIIAAIVAVIKGSNSGSSS